MTTTTIHGGTIGIGSLFYTLSKTAIVCETVNGILQLTVGPHREPCILIQDKKGFMHHADACYTKLSTLYADLTGSQTRIHWEIAQLEGIIDEKKAQLARIEGVVRVNNAA